MFEKLAKDPKLIKPARIAATIPIDHIDTRGMFLEFVLLPDPGSRAKQSNMLVVITAQCRY